MNYVQIIRDFQFIFLKIISYNPFLNYDLECKIEIQLYLKCILHLLLDTKILYYKN